MKPDTPLDLGLFVYIGYIPRLCEVIRQPKCMYVLYDCLLHVRRARTSKSMLLVPTCSFSSFCFWCSFDVRTQQRCIYRGSLVHR